MSIGPLGEHIASAAQAAAAEQRGIDYQRRAAAAAGVGQADGENLETDQRDAEGRRPWEETPENTRPATPEEPTPPGQGKGASDGRGTLLDLNG